MKCFTFICLFMLLAGPRLKFPDLNLLFTIFLSIISPYLILKRSWVSKEVIIFTSFVFFMCVISVVTVLYNDVVYFAPLEDSFKLIITMLASFSLFTLYTIYFNNVREVIIKHILITYIINGIFVVLVIVSSDFKNMASNYLSQNTKMVMLASESIRSFDLVMGGGAVASIVFSVIFMFSLSSFLTYNNKLSIFSMFFSFLSILFTGRTGLYLTLAFIFPVLLSFNYLNTCSFMFHRVIKKLTVGMFLSVIALTFVAFSMKNISPSSYYLLVDNNFSWAFEPVINFINHGQFSSLSSNRLMEMYSDDKLSFSSLFSLFGTAMSGRDLNSVIRTDIGYLRALYTSGFIGLLLIFGKYVYIWVISLIKVRNRQFIKADIPFIIGVVYYITIILIANFKEYHMFIRSGLPLLMIFILVLFNLKEEKNIPYNKVGR